VNHSPLDCVFQIFFYISFQYIFFKVFFSDHHERCFCVTSLSLLRAATCMAQQQPVLREYKKDADKGIVLWLNSNAEVSQSASKILQCSCLPAPCCALHLKATANSSCLPPLLQKQLASIEPAYYLNCGEAIGSSMQVVGEVGVEEIVDEAVELVKVVEELKAAEGAFQLEVHHRLDDQIQQPEASHQH
jgi:hypothetical protein